MKQYAIGVDFGSLSGRAVLVDISDGAVLASSVMDYPHGIMDRCLPGGKLLPQDWSLHHPADYLEVLTHTVTEVMKTAGVSAGDVHSIGVDCTASSVLPVTREGVPLCFLPEYRDEPHAYIHLWKHHAAQKYADRMTEKAVERGEKWLGAYGGRVSSESALPKLWQVLEEAPQVYDAMAYWIEAVDWLIRQLCGQITISSCCAGYKYLYCAPEGYPSDDYFASLDPRLAHIIEDKCSMPVSPLYTKAGGLTQEMAGRLGLTPGTSVAVGLVDAHACVPAAGITAPGEMVMILGTSACLMVSGETYRSVPGCYAVRDGLLPGLWGFEGGQNSVGDMLSWMTRECVPERVQQAAKAQGVSVHQYLSALAAQKKPGETGLLALDWFNGNRSILMDSGLTGMILGLDMKTAPEDIYRALAEAAAYGARLIIDTFRERGVRVDKLLVTGGISQKNAMMMQIYADVLDMPVRVLPASHGSALGSAIAGAAAAGCYPTVQEAIRHMAPKAEKVYEPDPVSHRTYERLYQLYAKLYRLFGQDPNSVMKELLEIKRAQAVSDE